MKISNHHKQKENVLPSHRRRRCLALLLFFLSPEDSGEAAGFANWGLWTERLKAVFWVVAAIMAAFAIARLH